MNNTNKKVAIVTGAGTGIGKSIALMLAKKGWKVVVCGRTAQTLDTVVSEISALGGVAQKVICDVTKPEAVKNLIAVTGNRLDALIHSAGIGHCLLIDDIDDDEWTETLAVAATGAFLTAKYALPILRNTPNGNGYIIQIGSLASGGTWEFEAGYGTAKGAQVKFTLHLDSQMQVEAKNGGRKIHVHAVCPGTVDTPFWNRIPQRDADPELTLNPNEVSWMVEQIIDNPSITAEELSEIKPREEIIVHRLSPYERWDNVIALKHESHP